MLRSATAGLQWQNKKLFSRRQKQPSVCLHQNRNPVSSGAAECASGGEQNSSSVALAAEPAGVWFYQSFEIA